MSGAFARSLIESKVFARVYKIQIFLEIVIEVYSQYLHGSLKKLRFVETLLSSDKTVLRMR